MWYTARSRDLLRCFVGLTDNLITARGRFNESFSFLNVASCSSSKQCGGFRAQVSTWWKLLNCPEVVMATLFVLNFVTEPTFLHVCLVLQERNSLLTQIKMHTPVWITRFIYKMLSFLFCNFR